LKQVINDAAGRAICIASPQQWSIVYVIVNGAGIVRLGDNAQQLANDPLDGVPLTAATPPQQSYVWWKGNLFALANVETLVSVQEPGKAPQGT
jgi:hypothetical protein